jgi:hypothetical protein
MNIDRTNIDQAIADRIATDPDFRSALVNDPRAALSDLASTTIPESIRVTVHEESVTDIHLVIPSDANLSESDLELVSGGIQWYKDNGGCCSL